MTLTAKLDELADKSQWDFSDLRALFINCTLKRSPEPSNTQGLADLAISIMEKNGVDRRRGPRRRSRHRDRRVPRHDRTRVGSRRLAPDPRAGHGRRHSRALHADLARREVVDLHAE